VETTDITVQILRDLRDTMNTRFDTIDKRFDAVDARLDKLESRVTGVEHRLGAVEGRLIGVESSVTSIHYDLVRLRPIGDGDALVKPVSRCERDIAELKQRLDDR
jgi:tetrahydromethanopterin S-methyltransferase subunit G